MWYYKQLFAQVKESILTKPPYYNVEDSTDNPVILFDFHYTLSFQSLKFSGGESTDEKYI